MKKLYSVICGKYRRFEMLYLLEKTLVLSVIYGKCKIEDQKIFKEKESVECNYFKNMCQEFRLQNIDETRNYFLEEIKQNELMSKEQKKGLHNSRLY